MRRLLAVVITVYVGLVIVAAIASRWAEVLPDPARMAVGVMLLSAVVVLAGLMLKVTYEMAAAWLERFL